MIEALVLRRFPGQKKNYPVADKLRSEFFYRRQDAPFEVHHLGRQAASPLESNSQLDGCYGCTTGTSTGPLTSRGITRSNRLPRWAAGINPLFRCAKVEICQSITYTIRRKTCYLNQPVSLAPLVRQPSAGTGPSSLSSYFWTRPEIKVNRRADPRCLASKQAHKVNHIVQVTVCDRPDRDERGPKKAESRLTGGV
jgi:hypothetical protein